MLHAWEKFTLQGAEQHFHQFFDKRPRRPRAARPSFRFVLKGKIDFLRMVRGDTDHIYRRLRNQIHYLDPTLVAEVLPVPPRGGPLEEVWKHWAKEYKQSVYHIEVKRPDGSIHGGTAFATRRGFFCTAEHVVSGELWAGTPLSAKVPITQVSVHPDAHLGVDVALLKAPIEMPKAPFFPIETSPTEVGEPVAVLGFPGVPLRNASFGLYPGRVESVTTDYRGHVFIQIGGDLAGGMSGGPVINSRGSVIGVVSEQTFEETTENVPARAYQQALSIKYLAEIDLNNLIDPVIYAAGRTGALPSGLRKLLGVLRDAMRP